MQSLLESREKKEKELKTIDKEIEKLTKHSPLPKRRKMEIDLKPSSVKWSELFSKGIVQKFTTMQMLRAEEPPSSSSSSSTSTCTTEDVKEFTSVNHIITKRFLAQNEGLTVLVCGNILAHIVNHLQSPSDDTYSIKIFSIVKEVIEDARKNKKTDYIIMRLINQRTVVVVELKPIISEDLGYLEKELAQLFLEVYYARREDTKSSYSYPYQYMLAILSDRKTWHVFVLDLRLPMKVKNYYMYSKPTISEICTGIRTLIKQLK